METKQCESAASGRNKRGKLVANHKFREENNAERAVQIRRASLEVLL